MNLHLSCRQSEKASTRLLFFERSSCRASLYLLKNKKKETNDKLLVMNDARWTFCFLSVISNCKNSSRITDVQQYTLRAQFINNILSFCLFKSDSDDCMLLFRFRKETNSSNLSASLTSCQVNSLPACDSSSLTTNNSDARDEGTDRDDRAFVRKI